MENNIKNIIESAQTFALFGHHNPDGDCIGALLGFGRLLEKMGKNVKYFTPTKPSYIYDFLPNINKISSDFDYGKYDLIVFLDLSEMNRIQNVYDIDPSYFDNHKTIVIDHHVYTGDNPEWYIISDSTAMSACEVIFEHTYKWWPHLYDENIATYFYLGLTTDSGNFRYDEDHKRIFTNALNLIELGADKKMVVNNAFRRKTFAGVKMMELLFKRLQKKGDLVYTRYTNKDLANLGIDREEADFGQVIIQDIDEAKATAIFRIDDDDKKCRISLRSKNFDVQKIAKYFGGGGHTHAAGCTEPRSGRFIAQVDQLSTKISQMIK